MASIRRNARQRKEFLFRKSLEGKDREEYEKKQRLKRAIENGDAVPKELRSQEKALRRALEMEGGNAKEVQATRDDEYQAAGVEDPKLFLTTSRDPSSRLTAFAKELKLLFPNCTRVNRGNLGMGEIVEMCRANQVTDMIMVHETRGEPDGIIVSHLPYGPTAYFGVYNTVLRHDIRSSKKMTLAHPHLVFHNFSTKLGERVQSILKYLFPVPTNSQDAAMRVVSFYNEGDFISFRHHRCDKADHKTVELDEMGPRFELKLFRIRLGSLDQPEADVEWELRPFMNSAKRRRAIGDAPVE